MNAVTRAENARGWEKVTADFHCSLQKTEAFHAEKLVTFVRMLATAKWIMINCLIIGL